VAELEEVTKRYGDKRVVEGFSTRVLRGDKIGLIGPNGCGKSTLLKLILGELAPDSGTTRLGTKVAAAYFDQFRAALDEEATLAETISPGSDFVEIDGKRKHIISYLADFLFPAERAMLRSRLSGGERNRLLLARLFSRPANVLVLDEPTNDLDIETLELLEGLLQDYAGTLFLVSHDRAFLDNVVTQTIAYEGVGRWKDTRGYSDWQPRAFRTGRRMRWEAKRSRPQKALRHAQAREALLQGSERARRFRQARGLEREQARSRAGARSACTSTAAWTSGRSTRATRRRGGSRACWHAGRRWRRRKEASS
jgi:ATP-binding cassette subfamily F protein uup